MPVEKHSLAIVDGYSGLDLRLERLSATKVPPVPSNPSLKQTNC